MLVTIEERMAAVETRATAQEANMIKTDQTVRDMEHGLRAAMQAMDERIERRFDSMDRRFHWMLAVQITTLLTLIGAAFSLLP